MVFQASSLIDLKAARLSKVLTLLLGLFLMACQRTPTATTSRIDITIPSLNALNSAQKTGVSAQAAFPTSGTLCFAVNVTGDGIAADKKACRPDLGITSNFVPPGQTLTVEVPSGANRKFEVFFYYSSSGGACPVRDAAGFYPNMNASKLYAVGEVAGINLVNETETVNIDISYPGDASTVAAAYGASCSPTNPPTAAAPTPEFGAIGGVASGSTIKVKYKINPSTESKILTGSTLKVKTF